MKGMYPSQYRNRYLGAMSLAAIENLEDKDSALVILPTGAIEQHGPHLPVGVDAMLGQAWLNLALAEVGDSLPVYVAPPVTYGKSNEHVGFPGSVWISRTVLRRLVRRIIEQLADWGFRRVAIFNTHGGNTSVLKYTLRELHLENSALTLGFLSFGAVDWGVPEQEATYGFHANTLETAWMLAAAPGLCRMEAALKEYPASVEDPGGLRPENAPATYAWISSDLSESGVMGDPAAATPEKGKEWMERGAALLADRIREWVGPST